MTGEVGRRPVLHALGGAVVGSVVAGVPDGAFGAATAARAATAVRTVALTPEYFRQYDGGYRSRSVSVPTRALIGFTWRTGRAPHLRLRARTDGVWSRWRPVHGLHDLPDAGTREARRSPRASQPLWLSGADRVEVWVHQRGVLHDLSLVVIDAVQRPGDRVTPRTRVPRVERTTTPGVPPQPAILTRADWGADESLRDGGPRYDPTIQQVHVHHTDTGNDYASEDVPGIIRAIYRYHTQSLGWSDIGYNFLVDRFGRIWEGRYGGISRPVRGAHTLGFNATSTGCSVIGDYQGHAPDSAIVPALVQVAAWKLGLYGRRADGTATVTSEGSDKFKAGRVVTLPTIDGHRDTNDTECPGTLLYDHLSDIRTQTQARLDAYTTTGPAITVTKPFVLGGTPVAGRRLVVTPATTTPTDAQVSYQWQRDGEIVTAPDLPSYHLTPADAGTVISVVVTLHRKGYADTTLSLAAPGPVLIASQVSVAATASSGTVQVTATVTAKSSTPPMGTVLIAVGASVQPVAMSGGPATATFTGVPPGPAAVSATYLGDPALLPSLTATSVTVPS